MSVTKSIFWGVGAGIVTGGLGNRFAAFPAVFDGTSVPIGANISEWLASRALSGISSASRVTPGHEVTKWCGERQYQEGFHQSLDNETPVGCFSVVP